MPLFERIMDTNRSFMRPPDRGQASEGIHNT